MHTLNYSLLVVSLLILPLHLEAQYRLNVGGRLGVSLASVHGNDVEQVSTREGITGGVFAAINVTPRFAVQSEVLFTKKGGRLTASAYDFIIYELDYVEIPVLAKYAPTSGRSIRALLLAGGVISFLDRGRWRAQWTAPNRQPRAFVQSPTGTDVGLVLGAQGELGSGRHKLIFDARYTFGLRSIDSRPQPVDEKHGTFSLSAGWSLGLVRRSPAS